MDLFEESEVDEVGDEEEAYGYDTERY